LSRIDASGADQRPGKAKRYSLSIGCAVWVLLLLSLVLSVPIWWKYRLWSAQRECRQHLETYRAQYDVIASKIGAQLKPGETAHFAVSADRNPSLLTNCSSVPMPEATFHQLYAEGRILTAGKADDGRWSIRFQVRDYGHAMGTYFLVYVNSAPTPPQLDPFFSQEDVATQIDSHWWSTRIAD
jgi:hypothetical protein